MCVWLCQWVCPGECLGVVYPGGCGGHPQTQRQTPLSWAQRQTPLDPEADTHTQVEIDTEAGGTHATGMHSCLAKLLPKTA